MWFRVAEYHTFFSPKDGLKSVIIIFFFNQNFYYFSLWIVFAAGYSQENGNLREDLCLSVSFVFAQNCSLGPHVASLRV